MRKKTITLHLARPSVSNFIDVLSDSARDQSARGRAAQSPSDSFGDGAVLYVFPGQPKPPDWAGQLSPYFQVDANLRSVAPCAIIAFRSASSIFVVTFSYAHVYLDLSKLEADFGLRVAVNILSDSKLKSVESANLGSAVRGIVQAAAQIDFHSFGFGDALDQCHVHNREACFGNGLHLVHRGIFGDLFVYSPGDELFHPFSTGAGPGYDGQRLANGYIGVLALRHLVVAVYAPEDGRDEQHPRDVSVFGKVSRQIMGGLDDFGVALSVGHEATRS